MRIPSDAVRHGRNAETNAFRDDKYVRCGRCGHIANLDRHTRAPYGSRAGEGVVRTVGTSSTYSSYFVDDFSELDSSVWEFTEGVSVSAGVMSFTGSKPYAETSLIEMDGKSVQVKLEVDATWDDFVPIGIYQNAHGYEEYDCDIYEYGGVYHLSANGYIDDVYFEEAYVEFDFSTHKYFKIAVSGGMVGWYWSTDGSVWNELASKPRERDVFIRIWTGWGESGSRSISNFVMTPETLSTRYTQDFTITGGCPFCGALTFDKGEAK